VRRRSTRPSDELRATSTLQLIEFGLDLRLLVAAANLFELLIHRTMKLAIHACSALAASVATRNLGSGLLLIEVVCLWTI
jgi:hypothetical protein